MSQRALAVMCAHHAPQRTGAPRQSTDLHQSSTGTYEGWVEVLGQLEGPGTPLRVQVRLHCSGAIVVEFTKQHADVKAYAYVKAEAKDDDILVSLSVGMGMEQFVARVP